jgi:hypothetical protein
MKRFDTKELLNDPVSREKMLTRALIFIQAVEGRDLTQEEADDVYERILSQGSRSFQINQSDGKAS